MIVLRNPYEAGIDSKARPARRSTEVWWILNAPTGARQGILHTEQGVWSNDVQTLHSQDEITSTDGLDAYAGTGD